jgi:hypothetical protein
MRRTILVTAALLVGVLLAACGQGTVAVPAKAQSTPTAAPTSAAGMVLLDISGRDSKQSQVFTAPDRWDVSWELVGDNNTMGELVSTTLFDARGNPVDQVFTSQLDPGGKRSDVKHMHHAGTFYLDISGIGVWHVKAVTT